MFEHTVEIMYVAHNRKKNEYNNHTEYKLFRFEILTLFGRLRNMPKHCRICDHHIK